MSILYRILETGQKDIIQVNLDDNIIRPLNENLVPAGPWTRISLEVHAVLDQYILWDDDEKS